MMYLGDILFMILYFIDDVSFVSLCMVWQSLMHEQVQGSSYGSILFILQRI
jgi:hypothetical protein